MSANHKAGEEAKYVSVTVSLTCTGIAYAAHSVYANATQMITTNARQTLGATYSLIGDIQVAIVHATITNQALRNLIAGKTTQQAQALLLQLPGVAGAAITITGHAVFPPSEAATLPDNPQAITIVVAERL